jgi:pimeloyl-ACP methyl ester carboxylesterase
MTPGAWPCPLPGGGSGEEYALMIDRQRERRLLIVPALFDEANRMRRFTAEVMRRLDAAGIDSVLPDLPGCNESPQPLAQQTPASWRAAMTSAAHHFGATHVLGIRGGALLTPQGKPGWHYAPTKGASILRQLIRSRILAARESGVSESQDGLLETGFAHGLELSGFRLGAAFLQQFQALVPEPGPREITQAELGGGGLWLRAEPDEDPAQADTLAVLLAEGMMA